MDAYFPIPIAPPFRKFLRFVWDNTVYQFRTLPFGISTAPLVFTRVFQTIIAHLHTLSVQIHSYLDDSLIRDFDQQTLVDRGIQFFPLVEIWDPGLFCSVPLEIENSEKESTPTSFKISKTPDLEKTELPFPFEKQEFVDRNPWSENRLDRNESEQTVCADELLLFETLLWRLREHHQRKKLYPSVREFCCTNTLSS
jgi:hypothetical protein